MANGPRIIVKFQDHLGIPYQDSAEMALPQPIAGAWQALVSAFPGVVLSLNKLLTTQSAAQIEELINTARNLSGEEPPNLLSLMAIDVSGLVDEKALLAAINALPFVEFAYMESPLIPPL
jgi:hypothetical protein